ALEDLDAVHARHRHVEENEVGPARLDGRERLGAAADGSHLITAVGEEFPQDLAHFRLVVDHEQSAPTHETLFSASCGFRSQYCPAWARSRPARVRSLAGYVTSIDDSLAVAVIAAVERTLQDGRWSVPYRVVELDSHRRDIGRLGSQRELVAAVIRSCRAG